MPNPTNPKPVIYRLNKRYDSLTSPVSNYDGGTGRKSSTIDGFTLQEDLLAAIATIQAQHEEIKFLREQHQGTRCCFSTIAQPGLRA